jgi:hypothetical protein
MLCTRMFFWYFLKKVQLILHRGYYQIVFALLIVLRFLFCSVTWPFWGLRSLVDLLAKFMLDLSHLLFFYQLATLEIPWSNWLSSTPIFTSYYRELQIVGFIHLRIFGSFSYGRSGQSFLIPTLINKRINVFCKVNYL